MDFVTREEWGAKPGKHRVAPIGANVEGAVVHAIHEHSDDCYEDLQQEQQRHLDVPDRIDTTYNWYVCSHGRIFEGRGWGKKPSANGNRRNNKRFYAVCYLGEFNTDGRAALETLLSQVEAGGKVLPHSYMYPTSCPGEEIVAWTKGDSETTVEQVTEEEPEEHINDHLEFRYRVELHEGSRGPSVKEWQEALRVWDSEALPETGVSGEFDSDTALWTLRFMEQQELLEEYEEPMVDDKMRETMKNVLNTTEKP